MNLLADYLADFNREFLSTPADRRRAGAEVTKGIIAALVIFAMACLLLLLG